MPENKKYRYNFKDTTEGGRHARIYQSETPYSASTHVLTQNKESKEDSPTAGHRDYSYNKKTGNVTVPHEREEDGVKIRGSKALSATKESEEDLKIASVSPLVASLLAKAEVVPIKSGKKKDKGEPFRIETKKVDNPKQYRESTQYSGTDEPSTHSIGFPKVGDNQSIRDKKYKYNPKEQTLEVENRIGNYGRDPKKYDTAGPGRNIPELINASKESDLDKGKFADPKTGKPLEGDALHSKQYSEEGAKKTYPKHVLNASPTKGDIYGVKEMDEYHPNKVKDIHDSSRAMKQEQYRTKKKGGIYVTEENDPRVFRHKTPAESHSDDISSDISTDKAIARNKAKKSISSLCDDIMEKTKATKMNRAFQNFARSEDKKIAKEEEKKHTLPRTSVFEGGAEVKNVSDKVVRVRPRQAEAMQLSKSNKYEKHMEAKGEIPHEGRRAKTAKEQNEIKHILRQESREPSHDYYSNDISKPLHEHVKDPDSDIASGRRVIHGPKGSLPKSISDQCDDLMEKGLGKRINKEKKAAYYEGVGRASNFNVTRATAGDSHEQQSEKLDKEARDYGSSAEHNLRNRKAQGQKVETGSGVKNRIAGRAKSQWERTGTGVEETKSDYEDPRSDALVNKISSNKYKHYNKSVSDQCDDILSKYMGTGRYSGSGENDPVVTKREGYTVRERALPGQTKESIKAGHIAEQKEKIGTKLEPSEKEKSKIRDEGYKLGQKNPTSQYAPPAPPEKKYSGSWRDFLKRSFDAACDAIMQKGRTFKEIDAEESPRKEKKIKAIERAKDKASYVHKFGTKFDSPPKQAMTLSNTEGEMNLKKTIDDLLEKCNSHVISSETEEGLKKKKKQAPKADGHTLGKNPPAAAEDMEMVKVDVEGAFKSMEKAKVDEGKSSYQKRVARNKRAQDQANSYNYSGTVDNIINRNVATSTHPENFPSDAKRALKYDLEAKHKSLDERTADLHKSQLPGLNKPAVKQTDKVKTTEEKVQTEKPKNLIRSIVDSLMQKSMYDIVNHAKFSKMNPDAYKQKREDQLIEDDAAGKINWVPLPGNKDYAEYQKNKKAEKSIDDRTAEQYIKKSAHLFHDIVQPEEKTIDLFHTQDGTFKSQKSVFSKWGKSDGKTVIGGRINKVSTEPSHGDVESEMNKRQESNREARAKKMEDTHGVYTGKDMASEGYTSLKKEDEDISHEEVKGRKRMDAMDVKAENKRSRLEYSGDDEGAE